MAGLGLGPDALRFLADHDRHESVFYQPSYRLQLHKPDGTVNPFLYGRRNLSSWDTFYFRLRSSFDGYKSSYYPVPAPTSATDGPVLYASSKELVDISRGNGGACAEEDDKVMLTVLDLNTQAVSQMGADLVIAADGPNSVVRSRYLQPDIQREYVGYVAWRGVVMESEVTEATRDAMEHSVNVHMPAGKTQHFILYMIPGEDGSLEPGTRYLNMVWFTNETPEALDEIMKDGTDGHRHRYTVPTGRLRPEVWNRQVERARQMPLPPAILEVVTKIKRPFVQVITESLASQAAFEDGKVLLVGEALCLMRVHNAFSATMAAFTALRVRDYVRGHLGLSDWEDKVLRFAKLHFWQAVWWGKFYQSNIMVALGSACYYWWLCGVDRLKCWWAGEEPLLRTTTTNEERS
jgi:2-polyprenyl-6-methoxyphenol hydroxylase-like FAD-dependent oxidoreductase